MKTIPPVRRITLLSLLGILLAFSAIPAGETLPPEPQNLETFLKALLRTQPRFQASGIFTSKVPGKPAVSCGARVRFDKDVGAVFSYNTTGEDLEPYDFYYWKRSLALIVFDRDRRNIVKSEFLGAPERPLFNFVWDVVEEGETGRGLMSLIFSGLMRMNLKQDEDSIQVTFRKYLVPLPIKELSFTFDVEYRLQAFKLTESGGDTHSFQVQNFQKLTEKLKKPKIQKKPPERH